MAYPPPPYADAVCGTHVCGEAICGTWWAYPTSPAVSLGGTIPQVDAINGDVPPPAPLVLGGVVPTMRLGYVLAVSAAGLKLGAPAPTFGTVAVAPQASLVVGASAPALKMDTRMAVQPAGLVLRAETPDYAGPLLLLDVGCEDVDLDPIVCETPVLVHVGRSVSLQAVSAPGLILQEVPADPVSLTGVEA